MHQALIFSLFTALCGGHTGLVSAKLSLYTAAEGGRGTMNCYLSLTGANKFFCKDQCEKENILIKTDGETAVGGRYSMSYKNASSGRGMLSVTIRDMVKSDSGIYRCGLGKTEVPESHTDFEVRVSDELSDKDAGFIRTSVSGETFRKPCFDEANRNRFFFCKGDCKKEEDILIETDQKSFQSGRYSIEYIQGSVFGLYVSIAQTTKSDMGRYKCGYGRALSPDSSSTFNVIVIDDPATSKPTMSPPTPSTSKPTTQTLISTGFTVFPETPDQLNDTGYFLPLVVCVPLVGVSLLVLLLLLLYKRRTRRNFGGDTRRNADRTNTELSVTYENFNPSHKCDEPIYQNSDAAKKN